MVNKPYVIGAEAASPQSVDQQSAAAADKVAAVQFTPKLGAVAQNRQQLLVLIEQAARQGAMYVVLPELALTGSLAELTKSGGKIEAETIPGQTTDIFSASAKKLGIWLVFSTIEKEDYGKGYYLTTVLIDNNGEIRLQRRKVAPRIDGQDGDGLVRGNPRSILESFDDGVRRVGILSGDDLQAGVPRLSARGAAVVFVSANLTGNEAVDWEITCRDLAKEHRVTLVVANSDSGGKIGGIYRKDGRKYGTSDNELNQIAVLDLEKGAGNFFETPLGLPSVPVPNTIALSTELVDLGRTMFFDKSLSRDGSVSCATCHNPSLGFTNGRNTGVGLAGHQTQRNVPSLFNVAYRGALFWDGYASTLENQSKYPMTHAAEMGVHYLDLVEQIQKRPEYARRFKAINGRDTFDFEDVSAAIAAFERSLLSGNSPFDRYYYGKEAKALSAAEKRGLGLFQGKANCVSCHRIENDYALFFDQEFHNTGVGYDSRTDSFKDLGHGAISYEGKSGLFFTPSLRNVAKTAPYMHDGSIEDLAEVVRFYNKGGNKNPYLDPAIKPLNLNANEISDLVAFLKTLNGDAVYDANGLRLPSEKNKTQLASKQEEKKIAALQFAPATGKVSQNVTDLIKLIRHAASQGARYIVLPEYALTDRPANRKLSFRAALNLAETASQQTRNRLAPLSRELGVWLIVPTLEVDAEKKNIYSTIQVWNEHGQPVHSQRKLSPHAESGDLFISRGQFKHIRAIQTRDGLIGVLSGGDILEGVKRLSELGAKNVFIASSWAATDGWDYLNLCQDLGREFKVDLFISSLKEKRNSSVNFGKIIDQKGISQSDDKVGENSVLFGYLKSSPERQFIPVPLGLPPVPTPGYREITQESIALGGKLFFDANLSRDGSISCASCHVPSTGFANHLVVAEGFAGRNGKMNVPTILNSAYRPFLGWEGKATSLEDQVLRAIHGFPEFDMTKEELVARLNQDSKYRELFRRITGRNEIDINDVVNVIADFQRILVGGDSPFDRFYYGGQKNALNEKAKKGFELFQGKANCSSCHHFNESYGLFSDFDFHNTGVGYHKRFEYLGYAGDGLEGNFATKNTFKGEYSTPSLRNVDLTPPYMHDGSVQTLEDVVRFYNKGGIDNPFLDQRIRPLNLTDEEQSALVEFLKSLTSQSLPELPQKLLTRSH